MTVLAPHKIYGEGGIEQGAITQFYGALSQSYVIQGALMPDAHLGYSLPIGGVVACEDVVVPAYVGYDIGCGMLAAPTTFHFEDVAAMTDHIYEKIVDTVPIGTGKLHKHNVLTFMDRDRLTVTGRNAFDKRGGFKHMGTLGGGNHFIEIGWDDTHPSTEDPTVWIIIHSGSRGLGHGIATEYMKIASGTQKAKEGHYPLEASSPRGLAYLNDVKWATNFAYENRRHMMLAVNEAIASECEGATLVAKMINKCHNSVEPIHGTRAWLHRKGATSAMAGEAGVVPGNMRDGSYIVLGKGNQESLMSSSHGAGRKMSRKQAKRELNLVDYATEMLDVTCNAHAGNLDEAPGAYKNIADVMSHQADLVDLVYHIRPMINVKG